MDRKKIGCESGGMQWVRQAREKIGISMYRLADMLGVKIQTLSRLERVGKGCRMEILSDIRRATGLSWEAVGELIDAEVAKDRKNNRKNNRKNE